MGITSGNGYRRKQRNSGTRIRRPIVLIATEGKNQTETIYFKDMAKARNRVVKFVPGNYTDPINIAQAMRTGYKELDLSLELGDRAFCLVDADCNSGKDAQLAVADRLGSDNAFKMLVSAPCFEVWFLCHFSRSAKKLGTNRAVIAELTKKIPDYSKSMPGLYAKTSSHIEDAIRNAKELEAECVAAGYRRHTSDFSPSTEIYVIVEELLK